MSADIRSICHRLQRNVLASMELDAGSHDTVLYNRAFLLYKCTNHCKQLKVNIRCTLELNKYEKSLRKKEASPGLSRTLPPVQMFRRVREDTKEHG